LPITYLPLAHTWPVRLHSDKSRCLAPAVHRFYGVMVTAFAEASGGNAAALLEVVSRPQRGGLGDFGLEGRTADNRRSKGGKHYWRLNEAAGGDATRKARSTARGVLRVQWVCAKSTRVLMPLPLSVDFEKVQLPSSVRRGVAAHQLHPHSPVMGVADIGGT
jgi:hypothetical protein